MKLVPMLMCVFALPPAVPAQQATHAPASKPVIATASALSPFLPTDFAGWETDTQPVLVKDVAAIDSTNAAALKEYGFTDGSLAKYTRDGQTLTLHALRFADATGAYGAYSFYRQPSWPKEEIGTGAASDHNRVVFWRGNIVIDANFQQAGVMTASELRDLAARLPLPTGNRATPPPILGYLPQKDMEPQSTRYASGPIGYTGENGILPPDLVGFDRGAEVASAGYNLRSGLAALTLISYPTPQMAAEREKAISGYIKAGNSPQHPWSKPLVDSNNAALAVRRSGPLVAIVYGDSIPDEERKLIESVHYDASLTNVPVPADSETQKMGKLVVGTITLVVILGGAALFFGLLFGGGRVFYRRMLGKSESSLDEAEFIRLHLEDEGSSMSEKSK